MGERLKLLIVLESLPGDQVNIPDVVGTLPLKVSIKMEPLRPNIDKRARGWRDLVRFGLIMRPDALAKLHVRMQLGNDMHCLH